MEAIFHGDQLILVPADEAEASALRSWKEDRVGHVLRLDRDDGTGLTLRDLGREEDACREPINVTSRSPDESVRLIGNLAPTPFELDGRRYASVESFWQGLKFATEAERRRVAALDGPRARRAGEEEGYGATFRYEGREIAVGSWDHRELMARACRAKFAQDDAARAALLATGDRPLTHKLRRDSRTIPGAILAEIWMTIRSAPWSRGG